MISHAASLFELSDEQTEILANSAGLSLQFEGGDLVKALEYKGKIRSLCEKAMISERMFRSYKHNTPTKQTLLALAVALDKSCTETDKLLHKYGYCLSDSIIGDVVVKWFLSIENNITDRELLIFLINETLEKMGVPLLMTKQSEK